MSYQKARYIRSHSLSNLLAGELSSGEGFGKSIKKVIGLKTKAKITGIKEKLDPLNIIKMLTFGSNLAPALLGRLFGRSQKDIQNFAGRSRLVGDKASKVGKLPGAEDTSGLTETLHKIYSFMKKSQEHDILMREKTNNFREEKQLEDERRHKELLKALGVTGPSAKVVKTNKPGGGLFDGMLSWLKDLLNPILKIWDDVSEFFSGKIWRTLLTAGEWLIKALLTPEALILALIAGGLVAAVFAGQELAKRLEQYQEDEARKKGGEPAVQALKKQREAIDHTQDEIGVVQNENLDNATDEKDDAIKRKQDIIAQFMYKKGYTRWQGFWDRHTGTYTYAKGKNANGKPPPPELLKQANDYADDIVNNSYKATTDEQSQKSRSDFSAQDPRRTDLTSENTTNNSNQTDTLPATPNTPNTSATPITPNTPATPITPNTPATPITPNTSATPITPTPSSSSVTPSSTENQFLQLQSKTSSGSSSTTTNNVVNSSVSKPQNNIVGMDIPAVRNTEDTLRRLFMYSTRLV